MFLTAVRHYGSYEVVRRNVSHGCVRVHVEDAAWLFLILSMDPMLVIISGYEGGVKPY